MSDSSAEPISADLRSWPYGREMLQVPTYEFFRSCIFFCIRVGDNKPPLLYFSEYFPAQYTMKHMSHFGHPDFLYLLQIAVVLF